MVFIPFPAAIDDLSTDDWLASYAEIACGISCDCMPAVPAFIRHVRNSGKGSSEQDGMRGASYEVISAGF